MSKWVVAAALLLSTVGHAKPRPAPEGGFNAPAREIQTSIHGIEEALAEATPQNANREEICFRVGMLYQVARYELDEVAAAMKSEKSSRAATIAAELIKDGRSLPSFCDDKEK